MKPKLAVGFALSMFTDMELECPTCEKSIEYGKYHRKCLAERHGGTIPEDIERLIEAFEFEEAE